MDVTAVLQDAFGRVGEAVHGAVDGLAPEDLTWRPDTDANTIGWLVWHLARVADDHLAEISGRAQVWTQDDWAPRFGLPTGAMDHGYGYTSAQVAALRPDDADTLLAYHDAVAKAVADDLAGLDTARLDEIIDDSWDPPVTVGVRIVSVLDDALQHAGQAGYVRGMWERRG